MTLALITQITHRQRSPKHPANPIPVLTAKSDLATTLKSLDGRNIAPTDARASAYLVVRAIEYMTRQCLTSDANLHFVSLSEREKALNVLVESISRFDWWTLKLDTYSMKSVLDEETITLMVSRISRGESLKFLEDLLYERFTALERFGPESAALSALRLSNPRRRGLSPALPHPLRTNRPVRHLSTTLGGKF